MTCGGNFGEHILYSSGQPYLMTCGGNFGEHILYSSGQSYLMTCGGYFGEHILYSSGQPYLMTCGGNLGEHLLGNLFRWSVKLTLGNRKWKNFSFSWFSRHCFVVLSIVKLMQFKTGHLAAMNTSKDKKSKFKLLRGGGGYTGTFRLEVLKKVGSQQQW